MNFIDGLNGLAAGVALIAGCFLAGIAAAHGGWFAYFASLLLVAGLAGFLPFNFPRARIFMGDVGSQFCGFILAVLAVVASRFDGIELSFLIVPMLLSGVLFDVAFTLARRALAGERLTEPHRGHLYQVAQRTGVPAVVVALVHWGFAVYGGGCAILFLIASSSAKPMIPLLTLLPQFCWLGFVAHRARRAGLTRWG
jgi:UDP-GlcNAc:undecaprenyl-phosphate GlcNAc-1-phosphate transferase